MNLWARKVITLSVLLLALIACASNYSSVDTAGSGARYTEEEPAWPTESFPESSSIISNHSQTTTIYLTRPIIYRDPEIAAHNLADSTVLIERRKQPQQKEARSADPSKVSPSSDQIEVEVFFPYLVKLSADRRIKIPGPPGEVRIWIGLENFEKPSAADMAVASDVVRTSYNYIAIQPNFPESFKVETTYPACLKLDKVGTEVAVLVTPQEAGVFKIGATVLFYPSAGCLGSPSSKQARTLKVEVNVDRSAEVLEKTTELLAIFWNKFKAFFTALVVLFLGFILYIVRRRLARTGFENDG